MAGIDLMSLLPLMMGGGKNLNPQDLMAMMMRGNGGGAEAPGGANPPPFGGNVPPFGGNPPPFGGGNMQMQLLMQMMSMMNRPKPPAPVGFRPVEGFCPCTPLLLEMMRKKR